MATWLLLSALALGQEPESTFVPGYLVLHPTDGSEIKAFPRYHEDRVHLAINGNIARLDGQVQGRSARWVKDIETWDSGGGTWYLTLYLERDDLSVDWEWQRDGERPRVVFTIDQTPEGVQTEEPRAEATIGELLADALPREQNRSRSASFHLMDGDALNPVLEASTYQATWPDWSPDVPARYKVLGYDLSDTPSLEAIDRYRQILTEVEDERMQALALWRLGRMHQQLELHREARHYFGELARREHTGMPRERVQLARAQAAFGSSRWDEARDACGAAWNEGAHDALVLECLGVVSLATGHPAPAPTGRALAKVAASPRARLLAGQLLLKDNRYQEAREPLTRATEELEGRAWTLATMNLGDTWFHQGELEKARQIWRHLTSDQPTVSEIEANRLALEKATADLVEPLAVDDATRELLDLVELRVLTHELVQSSPTQWGRWLGEIFPYLDNEDDIVQAEARYLVAQLQEALDEPGAAAEELALLRRDHPRLAARTDARERLHRVWDKRIKSLDQADRDTDLLAFHETAWQDDLLGEVTDTHSLSEVAEAWVRVGAPKKGLEVLRMVSAVNIRLDREDYAHLLRMAEVDGLGDRADEGLETLAFLRARDGAEKALGGRIDLAEGRLHAQRWQMGEAEIAWRKAVKDPVTRLPALVHLTQLEADAGRCREALRTSSQLLAEPSSARLPEVADGRIHLVRARCELALEDYEAAESDAAVSAAQAVEPLHVKYAEYLATRAAEKDQRQRELPENLDNDGVWAALLREEQAQDQFASEVDAYFDKDRLR